MPMYDLKCDRCGHEVIDVWESRNTDAQNRTCAQCGECGTVHRLWTTAPNVIDDTCDIWVKNGICNDDGTPRRYTSKAAMKREAEKRGLVNRVRHVGAPGSDKSKHTSRWI